MTRIAIIGAGIAGVTLAELLRDRAEIIIFEKSRGVSGRMSTRRAEPYFFDHGAQYFTARTPAFQAFLQPMLASGVIARWDASYVRFDRTKITELRDWAQEEPRYVGVPGMNAVARHLAQDKTIHLNTRIMSIKREKAWHLLDEAGNYYDGFDWVISTIPAPQAYELLPKQAVFHRKLGAVEMSACFSVMLGFAQPLALKFDAAHVDNADISWIAVNSLKPGRDTPFTLMVHSSEDYAQTHIRGDREHALEHLCNEASQIIGQDVTHADYKTIHGWLYANNTDHRDTSPLMVDPDMRLAACGDWCQGGRVEGAFTSAYLLQEHIT